ncbi:MAG: hypothetical protein WBA12_05815 [Catalinimonas sp.]
MIVTKHVKSAMSVIKIAQQHPEGSYVRGWLKSWENYYRADERNIPRELRRASTR